MREEFEIYGTQFRWRDDGARCRDALWVALIEEKRSFLPPMRRLGEDPSAPEFGKIDGSFAYRFENVAEFSFPPDGSSLKLFTDPHADPRAVEFALFRGVIPRLLHLRGVTCLHASAVTIGGRAVAFCGPSGSGKSTVAAAMVLRGHALITDDVLPLRTSGNSAAAGPGLRELRLHPSTAAVIGAGGFVVPPGAGQTKAIWRFDAEERAPLPLSAIYLLEPDGEVSAAAAHPCTNGAALLSLVSNSFWLHPGATSALSSDLLQLAAAVRFSAVSRLSFPLTETGFDAVERLLCTNCN
jgi:hypothetical protein